MTRNVACGILGVRCLVLRFVWLSLLPKAVLAAKLMATQSQLAACVDAVNRKKAPKPRFTISFRLLWIALSTPLSDWRKLAHIMRPATVVGYPSKKCQRPFTVPGRIRSSSDSSGRSGASFWTTSFR
jgi:hypothetical protein